MEHAPFSCSGMELKALCAASHAMGQFYPDVENEETISGTHTHHLIDYCLKQSVTHAVNLLGMKLQSDAGVFVVEADRCERAQVTLDYVAIRSSGENVKVDSEKRVNPGSLLFRDDWWGTSDVTFIDTTPITGMIEAIDHKDGDMPVSPFENPQGIAYLLGMLADNDSHLLYTLDPKTPARFTISQPNAYGVNSWTTTAGELIDRYLPLCADIIAACEVPNPVFTPGEHCQFCPHKLNCEARRDAAVAVTNVALGSTVIPVPGQAVETQTPGIPTGLPAVGNLTDEQIAMVVLGAPMARGWFKDVGKEGQRRQEAGALIPGMKLVQKKGRRKWVADTAKVFKILKNMTFESKTIWGKKDITVEVPLSFTKVLGNPKLSDAQRKRINDELIQAPGGSKALVPMSEPGEDISPATLLAKIDIPQLENQAQQPINPAYK